MITTLSGVIAYTEVLARECPEIASGIVLRRTGEADEGLSRLSADLRLPPSYKACAASLGLFGVSIGYFDLWPGPQRLHDLCNALRVVNNDDTPLNELARKNHLLFVGQEESDWICVGVAGHDGADLVHAIDIMTSPTPKIHVIAPDFERFLILAANLNQTGIAHEGDVPRATAIMLECCEAMGCTGQQAAFWKQRISDMTS